MGSMGIWFVTDLEDYSFDFRHGLLKDEEIKMRTSPK